MQQTANNKNRSSRNINSQNRRNKKNERFNWLLPAGIVLLVVFMVYNIANLDSKPSSDESSFEVGSGIEVTDNEPADIENYNIITKDFDDLSVGDLVLIGNQYKFTRDVTDELVGMMDYKSNNYSISDSTIIMKEDVAIALNNLLNHFYDKTGNSTINVTSGYRSYDLQKTLYENELLETDSEEAVHWVAKPGYSEHHSGYAVDINVIDGYNGVSLEYTGDGEFKELNDSAPDYGFVVRYQESKKDITGIYYEPWHFRYVGIPHSKIMQEMNFCFEEYIDFLKTYPIDGKHLKYTFKNKSYEIYYCKGYNVYVPKSGDYEISGNNVDGFIVTIIK